jgi:DNA (cytosine-5)-methyltransferase 1
MPLRAIELFAGVGGFRLGLEAAGIEVVWANQWEPGKKIQHAFACYSRKFQGSGIHVNEDVSKVDLKRIPPHDILTGGFPCQDYSVATTKARGIQGRKGVLWWEIHRILKGRRPQFFILENVDRLLKSPTVQRGRDFGVMLRCLADLGYVVEWRVVNAADYSGAQKRRRVFIVGYQGLSALGAAAASDVDRKGWLGSRGVLAKAFPVVPEAVRDLRNELSSRKLEKNLQKVSDSFDFRFENAGMMVQGSVWTYPVRAQAEPVVSLGSILEQDVEERFFVPVAKVPRWKYLKGAKAEQRRASTGFIYRYSEGAIPFPDSLDRPSRTLLTGEGGVSPSRFKHLIRDPKTGRLRVLTPTECERLNQFPDNWTAGMPENWRYFCMGNALVVGLVGRIAKELTARVQVIAAPTIMGKAKLA